MKVYAGKAFLVGRFCIPARFSVDVDDVGPDVDADGADERDLRPQLPVRLAGSLASGPEWTGYETLLRPSNFCVKRVRGLRRQAVHLKRQQAAHGQEIN